MAKNQSEVLVQRIDVYVSINIRLTNNHHIALQSGMALLGDLVVAPCIKPESTLCTRTATQLRLGAWTVWHLSRRRVSTTTRHGRSGKGSKFKRKAKGVRISICGVISGSQEWSRASGLSILA